jgi:HlyD family secretion protein
VAAAVLLLVLGGAGLVLLRRSAGKNRNLAPYVTTVEQGSLAGVITASGEIAADKRVNVSPKRQGQLQQLFVDEGDQVAAGQPLARMDPSDINNRLQELQAQVAVAQVELSRTRSEYERRRNLYNQGALSGDDMTRYRASFESSQAALAAAQQRLAQRSVESNDLVVRAPFAGVITNRFADPGSYVTPTTAASATAGATSSSIVELASGLLVKAKVPESDIGRIRLGQPAKVRVDAYPDRSFAARVQRISPRAEKTNNVTTLEVELALINPPADTLRIGMTADIDFDAGRLAPRPLVPTVAIVTEGGKPGVLVPGPNNQPSFRDVTLGSSSGRNTQVLSGLSPGEKVFIDLPPWAKKRKES